MGSLFYPPALASGSSHSSEIKNIKHAAALFPFALIEVSVAADDIKEDAHVL